MDEGTNGKPLFRKIEVAQHKPGGSVYLRLDGDNFSHSLGMTPKRNYFLWAKCLSTSFHPLAEMYE